MLAPEGSTPWLVNAAASRPGRAALIDAEGTIVSYGELLARAEALVPALAGGTGPVALELEPGIDHATALHAAILAGRPAMTIRPGLPEAERRQVLAAGAPGLVWGVAELTAAPEPAERPAGVAMGALAGRSGTSGEATLARVLSSGTTGPRRAVDLTVANFAASAASSAANLGVNADDVWLACMPMDHVGGLSILTRSVIYGTAALVHARFDVGAVVAALEADDPRVTLVSLVPTQLRRLLDAGAPLDRVRVALIGGAALDRETLDRALGGGVPVVQSYGLTEACSQVCTLAPAEATAHRGSSGRALPGIEVEVGDGGRIWVRGGNVAPAAAGPTGWLETTDVGHIDADGYLWVEGRADDVIVSGGENVRPEPVENVLLADPGVAEAAVVGLPDPEWGQRVVAFVVAEPGARPDAEALIARCRAELARPMVPKHVELVASLPRTAAGKLQRRRLRDGV